ncbi:MAG TPA: hypothetical protein VNN80_12045 [Polyangiaceae bacterium]|nr:hypothetical protein [Polyangiaceae bacterium]
MATVRTKPKAAIPKASKARGGKAAGTAASSEGLEGVFRALRATLAAHAGKLVVKHDGPKGYQVVGPKPFRGKELFVGAVRIGKAYVSYDLFPVYVAPELLEGMTPALEKRMQGKACFNFKAEDEALFRELGELTKRGVALFAEKGML